MTENKPISDRKYASYLARKYFSGQISKFQILDTFPNFENDSKIRLLHKYIMDKPRRSWFFGLTKDKYENFIKEVYEIIEELETDNLIFKTMKILLNQLWLQSNNCSEPIQNIGFQIFEVSKMTYNSKKEVSRYFDILVGKNYIKKISEEPLLYEFTESGKKIKTDSEIEYIIKNIA